MTREEIAEEVAERVAREAGLGSRVVLLLLERAAREAIEAYAETLPKRFRR